MSEEFRLRASTVLEVAQKVALPILLGVAGWTFTALRDHELRLTRIESTRYTTADATRDLTRAAEERAGFAAQLAVATASGAETVKKLDKLSDKFDQLLIELRRSR